MSVFNAWGAPADACLFCLPNANSFYALHLPRVPRLDRSVPEASHARRLGARLWIARHVRLAAAR